MLNSAGGAVKTMPQWKKTIAELKTNTKRRAREVALGNRATGGGSQNVKKLTESEERLMGLILGKNGKDKACCLHCNKMLSCKGSSTSNLHNHLKVVHQKISDKKIETINKKETPGPSSCPQKQTNIVNFVKQTSLEEIVAKLAANDGLSINSIVTSSFIRESLRVMYSSTNKNLGGRHKDPVWGFFTEISSESGKITGQECKECGQIVSSRALRMKKHTQTCSVVQSKAEASKRVLSSDSEDDVPLQQHIIRSRSSSTTSASPSTSSSSISVKKQISTPSTSGSKNFLQPKILSHVITTTTTQADQLDLDVARYMFSCNVPFSHVGKFYFQKLLNNLRPGYKPPTRQKLATKLLDTIHNEVVTEASDYLSGKMVLLFRMVGQPFTMIPS
ncbi:hypothetical protein CBL_10592 [Carabus blaptoides fortunei]